jgi:glycolate oxidase FAD binding subunit
MTDVAAGLAEIVGAAHVVAGDAAGSYAVHGRLPRWVAFPGAAEEVGRCLALASAHRLAVVPAGRGTRLHWGSPPRALDLVLSLRRLDRILAHAPEDLTMSVEGGATLGAIDAYLTPRGQLLPLDPPRASGSTVGGIVATAASGPYRARYGTVRDLLLGVTVALADGRLVKGGGVVVKNVTGYDVPKLHVGALGTLGVVVTAHLRLHPRPAETATWLFQFASAEAALEAALGVMDAPVVVSRLQLVGGTTLGVAVGSVREGVRAQGARIADIVARGGGALRAVDGPDAWWTEAGELGWPDGAESLTLRIGVRPTDVVKALRALEVVAGGPGATTAEVANGVLHARLDRPADPATLVARLRDALAALDASCVVEHAPAGAPATVDVWGDVGAALEPMRRLKAELDPLGILSPGRYVGGI